MNMNNSIAYHVVLEAIPLLTSEHGLPTYLLGEHLYIVRIGEGDLANPNCEPIGITRDLKGDVLYLWRDAEWADIDIDKRYLAPGCINAQQAVMERSFSRTLYRL